jgi:Ca2+-binding EF-hand superfamily protein
MFASIISLSAALIFATATAPAAFPTPEATHGADTSAGFDELDRNNDGVLTPDELPPQHELSRLFAQYDRDADNALSRSEFELYMRGNDAGLAESEDDDDSGEDDED